MANMYLMSGLSGSGKTTYSKKFAEENNILRLGVDEFYEKINGDECRHYNKFEVWVEFFKAIHDAEMNGVDCIIDTNALTWHQRMQFVEWFPTFKKHIIFIDAKRELCKNNNRSRRRQIPDDVMDKMASNLEVPVPGIDTNWDSIIHIKNINNEFMEPVVLKGEF
jgi:predicted kinase